MSGLSVFTQWVQMGLAATCIATLHPLPPSELVALVLVASEATTLR